MLHVPYKDVPNSTNDLLAGYVKLIFADPRSALPHIRSGKLRPYAVTGESRHPDLPDLPTVAEEGYPGFESGTWLGLFGPIGLSPEIVAKLHSAVQVAIANPKLRNTFAAQGTQLIGSTPQRFAEIIRSDSQRWGEVIKTAGIKVD
jgi:tripartite-type tricarboxylate transporter receptor subunit TctC